METMSTDPDDAKAARDPTPKEEEEEDEEKDRSSPNDHNPSRPTPTTTTTSQLRIQFDQVAAWIREGLPESSTATSATSISVDDKLRLYGLYKHVTCGHCRQYYYGGQSSPPSMFRVEAYAKYQAWLACDDLTLPQAMQEYIHLATAHSEWLRQKYEALFHEQEQDQEEHPLPPEPLANVNTQKGHPSSAAVPAATMSTTTTTKEAQPAVTTAATLEESGKPMLPSNNDNTAAEGRTSRTEEMTRLQMEPHNHHPGPFASPLLRQQPPPPSRRWARLIPRGQLDISYGMLAWAARHCLFGTANHSSLNQCRLLEQEIARLWQNQNSNSNIKNNNTTTWTTTSNESGSSKSSSSSSQKKYTDPQQSKLNHEEADENGGCQVLVGLSVRSLFDLYLLAKEYPPGSEIIVTPPITVPGMLKVLEYHQIKVVGVDVHVVSSRNNNNNNKNDRDASSTSTSSTTGDDDTRAADRFGWNVNSTAIRQCLSSRTVAIMVVHVFGCIVHVDWKELRRLANIHNENNNKTLDLIEDCAQIYSGLPSAGGYGGSPLVDVSLFSFGLIKTATALGGGIALIRHHHPLNNSNHNNNKTLYHKMDRLQWCHGRRQSKWTFLKSILKALVFLLVSHNPYLYSIAVQLVVTLWSLARFRSRSSSSSSIDEVCESWLRGFSSHLPLELYMQQVRQKPCTTLVASMLRQFQDTATTRARVLERVDRGRRIVSHLNRHDPSLLVLDHHVCSLSTNGSTATTTVTTQTTTEPFCTFWLLPVRYPKQSSTQQQQRNVQGSRASNFDVDDRIRAMGFDVSRSSSQLIAVSDSGNPKYPNAARLMKDILYLPITSPQLSSQTEIDNLCTALLWTQKRQQSTSSSSSSSSSSVPIGKPSKPRRVSLTLLDLCLPMLLSWEVLLGTVLFYHYRRYIAALATIAAMLVFAVAALTWFILWSIADFYLNHSYAFAKYSWLIKSKNALTENAQNKQGDDAMAKDEEELPRVIEAMNCLRLPQQISEAGPGKSVLMTGATGFIGSMLLYDLLKFHKELGLSKIIVLCRGKKGDSPSSRIRALLSQRIFDSLRRNGDGRNADDDDKLGNLDSLIEVVEGNVTESNLGITSETRNRLLTDASITHVFHCAAAVNFTQPLEKAAKCNISAPLEIQRLAGDMANDQVTFVHLSTAFVHGSTTGTRSTPIGEGLFSLEPYNPSEIYRSMLGSQYVASKCNYDFGFPNTYTFSKCVCEHLLLTNSKVKTVIFRPSIVGPSVQYPFEGWCGSKPSTFVAAACLYLNFQWNLWYFGPQTVPCIPVDVLTRFILRKAFDQNNHFKNKNDTKPTKVNGERKVHSPTGTRDERAYYSIHNVTWDVGSTPSAEFSWLDLAVAVTQLGAFMGYFSRLTACIGLFVTKKLLPRLQPSQDFFRFLHSVLVVSPFNLAVRMGEVAGFDCSSARMVLPFLDLPVLFFPFSTASFYFSSELIAPSNFVGERYAFLGALTAHEFSTKRRNSDRDISDMTKKSIVDGGTDSSLFGDLAWAFGQPRGRLVERVAAGFLSWLLRTVCSDVTVDVKSFSKALRATMPPGSRSLLLAPTHRSFFDFLLVSYVCFSIPELQIDLPVIAAASEFSNLPFMGWIIPLFRAFFVHRGKGKVGVELASRELERCIGQQSKVVEVYIEGSRSRDRRFISPKTGLMRYIQGNDPGCVVLPITINYEQIPDQESLAAEARDGLSRGLNLSGLLSWLQRAMAGDISLGRIHVAAAPILVVGDCVDAGSGALAVEVQKRQQDLLMVSSYHIAAASKLFNIPERNVEIALKCMNCPFWANETAISQRLSLPDDKSELWTIVLQGAHFLEPLVRNDFPRWASWMTSMPLIDLKVESMKSVEVQQLAFSISTQLTRADECIQSAVQELKRVGFDEPSADHVLQIASKHEKGLALLLLRAALEMRTTSERSYRQRKKLQVASVCAIQPHLLSSNERLGFWGFHDTSLILNIDKRGTRFVSVTGGRYMDRNKRLTKLVPFVEKALGVKIEPAEEVGAFQNSADQEFAAVSLLGPKELESLRAVCGLVSLSAKDRMRHGAGHSLSDVFNIRFGREFRIPDIVVWPSSTNEVVSLVSLATKNKWCLIPFGGGTNVSRAVCCPTLAEEPRPIISVDMTNMNGVLKLDHENNLAFVQAGITGKELKEQLGRVGYTFGHEPDSIEFSTLGGWIATKASGMKRNRYGNIEDIVTGLDVVGAEGLMKHGYWGRESYGLDPTALMLGSEGCLGIIVSAVLRIRRLPDVCNFDAVLLPDFDIGLHFMRAITHSPIRPPASLRLLDNEHFQLGQALRPNPDSWYEKMEETVTSSIFYSKSIQKSAVACLVVGYEGSKEEVCLQQKLIRRLANHLKAFR